MPADVKAQILEPCVHLQSVGMKTGAEEGMLFIPVDLQEPLRPNRKTTSVIPGIAQPADTLEVIQGYLFATVRLKLLQPKKVHHELWVPLMILNRLFQKRLFDRHVGVGNENNLSPGGRDAGIEAIGGMINPIFVELQKAGVGILIEAGFEPRPDAAVILNPDELIIVGGERLPAEKIDGVKLFAKTPVDHDDADAGP
jgi:hypothetical protein